MALKINDLSLLTPSFGIKDDSYNSMASWDKQFIKDNGTPVVPNPGAGLTEWQAAIDKASKGKSSGDTADTFGANSAKALDKLLSQNESNSAKIAAAQSRSLDSAQKSLLQQTEKSGDVIRQQAKFYKELADEQERMRKAAAEAAKKVLTSADIPDEVKARIPAFTADLRGADWDSLPYSEQNKRYQEYLKTIGAEVQKAFPKLDANDLNTFLNEKNVDTMPVKPKAGAFWRASDALGQVFNSALSGVGSAGTMVLGKHNPVSAFVDWHNEGTDAERSPVAIDNQKEKDFRMQQIRNDTTKTNMQKVIADVGDTLTHPTLDSLGALIGNILPGLGVAKGAQLAGLGAKGILGATAAYNSAAAGGDAYSTAYQGVMDTPIETLRKLPEWGQTVSEAGGDENAAREALAGDVARSASYYGAAIGAAGSLVPGSFEHSLAQALSGKGLAGALAKTATGAAIGGAEEGATALAGNIPVHNIDPNYDVTQGVGESIALGALGEGVGGGVAALTSRRGGRGTTPEENTSGTSEGSATSGVADAINDVLGGRATPAVDPTAPITDVTAPIVDPAAPVTDTTAPIVDPAAPVTDTTAPITDTAAPVTDPAALLPGETAEVVTPTTENEGAISLTGPANEALVNDVISGARISNVKPLDEIPEMTPQQAVTFESKIPQNLKNLIVSAERFKALAENSVDGDVVPAAGMSALINNNSYHSSGILNPSRVRSIVLDQTGYYRRNAPALRDFIISSGGLYNAAEFRRGINASQPWMRAVTQGKAHPLEALATSQDESPAVRESAKSVLNMYKALRVPLPKWTYDSEMSKVKSGRNTKSYTGGMYDALRDTVHFGSKTSPTTIVHEYLHGITAKGMMAIDYQAKQGNALAKMYTDSSKSLISFLSSESSKNGRNPRKVYGLTNPLEMVAELSNPEFVQLAQRYTLADIPDSIMPQSQKDYLVGISKLSEQSTLVKFISSLVEVAGKVASAIANKMTNGKVNGILKSNPKSGWDLNVADAIGQLATQAARVNGDVNISEGRVAVDLSTPVTREEFEKASIAKQVEVLAAAAPNTTPTVKEVMAAIPDVLSPAAATTVTGNALTPPRETASDMLQDINRNAVAPASNPWRGFKQNLGKGRFSDMYAAIRKGFDQLNINFHDSSAGFKHKIEEMAEIGAVDFKTADDVINGYYTAPDKRDVLLKKFSEKYGAGDALVAIKEISRAHKISEEQAIRLAGTWLTAKYAPQANKYLVTRNLKDIQRNQEQIESMTQNINSGSLNAQTLADITKQRDNLIKTVADQTKAVQKMQAAIADTNLTSAPTAPVAAGMSDAMAAALVKSIEGKVNPSLLAEVEKNIRKMNAYRLAIDVESGKVSPAMAAEFLSNPDVRQSLEALKSAADMYDPRNPESITRRESLRDQVAKEVESSYVPFSGNPNMAIDETLFAHGTSIPNTVADYRMEGRTSIPDDGVSASMAGLVKSATYHGYRDFQDAFVRLHDKLSPEARNHFGLHERIPGQASMTDVRDSIIVRRGGAARSFYFNDRAIMDAIQKSNLEQSAGVFDLMTKGTRPFAYMATQLNFWFGPRQIIRDGLEKADNLAAHTLLDAQGNMLDSSKIAKSMVKKLYVSDGTGILRASFGEAFNTKTDAGNYHRSMLSALIEFGGISTWGQHIGRTRDDITKMTTKAGAGKVRSSAQKVGKVVEAWNRAYEVAPSLAAFESMVEAGMDPKTAAAQTLDLMNFRKKGAKMAPINALYAFAQPAVTGGVNVMNALVDRKTGRLRPAGVARLMTRVVLLTMIQSILRGMTDDDEGGNKLDQLGTYALTTSLPIPFGDDSSVKIPLPYGIWRIANGIARGIVGVADNEKSAAEATSDLWNSVIIPGVSPISSSEIDFNKRPFEWFMATFAPSIFKPATTVAINRTDYDTPVVDMRFKDNDRYNWEQFGQNTAPLWKDIAEGIWKLTGKSIDLAPEQVRAFVRGSFPGLIGQGGITEFVERPYREAMGRELGGSYFSLTTPLHTDNAVRGQFYRITEDVSDLAKRRDLEPDFIAPGSDEAKLLQVYESWQKIDTGLRTKKASVTRSPITDEAKEEKYKAISAERNAKMRDYVMKYREILGKTTEKSPPE